MPGSCPPEETLHRLLEEPLSPRAEEELDEHLRNCAPCQQRLERLSADAGPARDWRELKPLTPEFSRRLEDSLNDLLGDEELTDPLVPPTLSGYEFHEIIGRGGTSVVYRARDLRLQRTVAIKVLRDRAGRAGRERFAREARALAALHHPNITRVVEVGEAQGQVFLVLEYIAGQSLGRYIDGEPQPAPSAARLVRQLADAMHAAHVAGLVHRDLKPGNILLDPCFGPQTQTGLDRFVPKVTDFGIVKDLNEDASLTRTRDCLGTPSYMAPEQVQGSETPVDCRTDVYALGAILYELLTGRPPFRAGTPLDTMLQVKQDEPVTPSRFQPRVPRDLENVCLKCLEKSPAGRYPSARALAEELDRFLEGRPVQARPVSWWVRLWRASRRRPGWAAAACFSAMILLALAIGGPLVAQREAALRAEAQAHEQRAEQERARARDHLDLASQALERTLEQALRSARLMDSALDEVRSNLIRGALPYLEQFVQREAEDQSLRLRQCRALLQLAVLQVKEGNTSQARDSYQRCLQMLRQLEADGPAASRAELSTQASAHMEYGRFLQVSAKDDAAAEQHYQAAWALTQRLLAQDPANTVLRDSAAIQLSLLGTLAMHQDGQQPRALDFLKRSAALRDGLLAELPERHDLRHYAALAHMNLGMLHRKASRFADEIAEMRKAWELELPLSKLETTWPETPYTLSMLEGELGVAYFRGGQRGKAMEHLASALRLAEALVTAYPGERKFAALRQRWQEAVDYAVGVPGRPNR